MADGKIKGITLEIGGDTSPLDKALKGVNKQANALQGKIRAVDKALKLDPTNTELLTQKQKLLGAATQGVEDKVKALKDAKARADADMADGTEVNERQYRELQREIVTAEGNLKSLEKQARETGGSLSAGISEAGKKLQGIGGGMAHAGKSMLPATGAIVGVGAAAVSAMNDVDDGLDAVMKKTGATGDTAKELEDVFSQVAANIPGEFSDIGAAVGEVNTRLGFTGGELQDASEAFLKFAKVNGTDVNTSVQLVTRAMGDAGIAANEYGGVLDALTVAGQQSGISTDKLAENLAKYGAPLRALGIDTQDAIAMFAGWEKAGVNTEIAFSGMKKAISTWGSAGKDSTVEFQKAMDAIKAAPDISSATSLAIETFGAKAGPDLADAIRAGRFEIGAYTQALQDSAGAVDGTYGMVVDAVDDAALAAQNMKLAMHDVGEVIAKTVGPMLLELVNKVKGVFEWFGSLDEGTQKTILTVLAMVAALGPLLMIVGQMTAGMGTLMTGLSKIGPLFSSIGGVVSKLGALIMANPIIAVIAAVIAAVVLLWNNCEWFRDGVTAAWNAVKEAVGAVVNSLVVFFTETIPNAWNSVVTFFRGIPAFFASLWASVKQFFVSGWQSIVAFVTQTIPAMIANIGAWFAQLPYKIGYALGAAVKKIAEWGTNILTWITTTLPQIIGNIVDWFAKLPGRIWEWLVNTIQKIGEWGVQTLAAARTAASNTITAVVGFFAGLPSKVWSWLTATVTKVVEWGTDMVSTARDKMIEFGENIISALRELPGKVLEIGKNIITGIWDGITGMAGWIKDKITGWCGNFVQGFKDALGIKSPSREFRDQVGKNVILGINKGLDENAPAAIKKAGEISKNLLSAATQWVDDKKFFNQMSLDSELKFWQDLKSMSELQGDELCEIDKRIYTAEQSLLQQQQGKIEEYQRNMEARAESLRGFAGIFDKISRESDVTGSQLLDNLRGQVGAFEDWQKSLQTLIDRGIDGDLLAELREKGPQAVNEIEALTQLNDDQLAEYGRLNAEKTFLATQQALREMGSLTIPVQSVAAIVGDLNAAANYATTPTAQLLPAVDEAERERNLIGIISNALLGGLTMIGDSIFDAIPKQADFNVDGARMARATWDAYDDEGSRRQRYYAPTREDIAAIALSVMPKPIKG